MLIQVGSNETLLADATRLAARAGAADVAVTLGIWPHMIHAWPYGTLIWKMGDARSPAQAHSSGRIFNQGMTASEPVECWIDGCPSRRSLITINRVF